jgi:hypothetical protein
VDRGAHSHLVGASVEEAVLDLAGVWWPLVSDTQLRWLGPEKGVIHLATAALVNAAGPLNPFTNSHTIRGRVGASPEKGDSRMVALSRRLEETMAAMASSSLS